MTFITILLKIILSTDTGSLTYEVKSKNAYERFFKQKDLLDFSNYPKDSKFFDETNKKVIDKMKDESGEVIVIRLFELKSKMHSMKKKLMEKNVIQKKE